MSDRLPDPEPLVGGGVPSVAAGQLPGGTLLSASGQSRPRPLVVINVAATVDGKIDTRERRGAPISSDADRHRVDQLRAACDAVMVGGRTLRDEDPRLTVRSDALRAERRARGQPEQPAKVGVLSTVPRLRPDARFLNAGPARIILFVGSDSPAADIAALRQHGVEIFTLGGGPRVDLAAALNQLVDLGIRRVLVEGGASLNFELLRLGLVDEVLVYIAPLIFGGATAPTLADGAGLPRELALQLSRTQIDAQPDGGVLLRYKVEPT